MEYVTGIRDATPHEGMVRLDADTTMSPGSFEAALRAAGGATYAVDEVMGRQGGQRLRRHAPARPPRRDRAADGLLPLQQRRDRGAPRAEAARRRARRHRRFRRAPRQRLAGNLLVRSDRDVLLDPPDAALSRHRRRERARRAQHHRQRAAAPGDGGDRFREAIETVDPAAAAQLRARPRSSSRPASTPTCATRSPISSCSRPTSPG